MSPDFSDEPMVRAAIQLNEARVRSASLTYKLMFYVIRLLRPTGRGHRLQR
jgi:hypothetical protein